MPDDTPAQLAGLTVQMQSLGKTIDGLAGDFRTQSATNATEHADVRTALADLKLKLAEQYATRSALERVDERGSERHRFAMERVETVALRINALEAIEDKHAGVTLGIKGLLGTVAAALGAGGVVTALITNLTR
jgi:hypothetical protein